MRIVIVKLSSIGDVVHALPAAALLRRSLPEARIIWAVDRRASAILKGSAVIDELVELDTMGWRKGFWRASERSDFRYRIGQLGDGDRNGGSSDDVAIDFQGLIKSGLVTIASRASRRIGFETAELREKASRLFLTRQVATSGLEHVIEKNLALARAAIEDIGEPNIDRNEYEFPIEVSSEDEQYAESVIGNEPSGFALINPGGGWPTKLWPVERYAHLVDWLRDEFGFRSYVTYGPGEEQMAGAVAANARPGSAHPVASTLKQFVALARRAALFVGGDTGPLHLAAASRTPIVGLYGPTSPRRNGPFDPRDVTVGRNLWCRAQCHRRSCWHWECMDISVDEVKAAVRKRLTKER